MPPVPKETFARANGRETPFAGFTIGLVSRSGEFGISLPFSKEHGTTVRLVTTHKPGKIVYSDRYQVVAETPYWARSTMPTRDHRSMATVLTNSGLDSVRACALTWLRRLRCPSFAGTGLFVAACDARAQDDPLWDQSLDG